MYCLCVFLCFVIRPSSRLRLRGSLLIGGHEIEKRQPQMQCWSIQIQCASMQILLREYSSKKKS